MELLKNESVTEDKAINQSFFAMPKFALLQGTLPICRISSRGFTILLEKLKFFQLNEGLRWTWGQPLKGK